MYGHWIHLEELPEKFLEPDIPGTLETETPQKQAQHRFDPQIKSSEGETVRYKDS